MDLGALFKMKQSWEVFTKNHPRVPAFLSQVGSKGACENMEIAVAVRYPDGTEFKTGIRVVPSDLQLLDTLKNLK